MIGLNPTEIFEQEAQELLDQLEQVLLDMEGNPDNGELIDGAFRALHTIKGSGAMFGFEAVASFTHHVETAFDCVRQGKLGATPELIALTLAAKDHIRRLIDHPGDDDAEVATPILHGLQALVDGIGRPAIGDKAAVASWRIQMRLPKDTMSMGTNPLILLDDLRLLGPTTVIAEIQDVPPIARLDPSDCHLSWTILLSTSAPRTAIEDVFLFVIDDMELGIERIDTGAGLASQSDRPIPAGNAVNEPPPKPAFPRSEADPGVHKGAKPPRSTASETRHAKTADSVRVPAERLDDLMDRVGELVIAQSRLSQVASAGNDPQIKSIAEDIERLTLELRDTTMGVRTVAIVALFGRFRRLIHDLGKELGKEIELTTVGEETELDKTLIEQLSDPLIHLLRNAVDHGLEQPEQRLASGKPRCGRITLTARHSGAEILISIADDGRGLDRDRIRARAEENGLLVPGQAITDNELFQVIFEPGFSTAREVTSLSGRGVGMDVVKRALEGLRGKIDITSVTGSGTELTLRLPLTLAIIDGLLVRIGLSRYVLPLSTVEECVELSTEQDTRSHGCSFLNIRGDLVPFLRLRELFATSTPPDTYQKVVVVSSGKSRVGLVVDQVIGNHQTVIKSLSRLHAQVQTFSGATILGDGTVALILDVGHLVDFGQAQDEHLRATG
ncbi:chemotaxis protein CheA [Lichenicola sp.]|uniref:chemotaxis protein CheA n=1 Tax=Lichenicola sp. TaxID=2804529 RepID=UPI003B008A52